MSARIQRQLVLAIRSAKAARTVLARAWVAPPETAARITEIHAEVCGLVERLNELLRAEKAKSPRVDVRALAAGDS